MTEQRDFKPDWFSAPGDTMAEILEQRHLSPVDFARRIGKTSKYAQDLLDGRATITVEIARQLARVLGASETFWINRESQYRADLARLQREWPPAASTEWLDEVPVKDMLKFGWVDHALKSADKVRMCLRFFGVPNVDAWRETYRNVLQAAALRTSPSFESQPGALAAWLRQGELEAASIECGRWDAKRFQKELLSIRTLTRKKQPNVFVPELRQRCAACGVAVVVVRAPAKCRASGATRFLAPGRRLLLLSFRYLSDDQFWFTFFHEAGHLLLHSEKALFLEGDETTSSEEEGEANAFAADILIPSEFQEAFLDLRAHGLDVIRFARQVGVSPGIIVGQLQHLRRIERNQLNNLKRRFTWGCE